MLYVSVRWSRLVEEMCRRSSGRIGRIVAMLGGIGSFGAGVGGVEAAIEGLEKVRQRGVVA